MNGVHAAQDVNNNNQEDQEVNGHPERPREEIVADLIPIINSLFDPTNIVHNAYLIKRAKNEKFEVPIQVIYAEKSIKNLSDDKEIVNEALEKSENVIVNKKDNVVQSVTLRNNELRRKITVQNIPREKRDPFKQFVTSLEGVQEDTLSWNFNKLNFANILCKDEEAASNLYKLLSSSNFEDAALDVSLNNDNIYISALENLKRKTKNYPNQQNPMDYINYMNPTNPMNARNQMYAAYNMMGYNPYMTGYPMNNYYQGATNYYNTQNYRNVHNNYYQAAQTQSSYSKPIQSQNNTYNKKNYNNTSAHHNNNQNYNNAYTKKNKQPREKNYKYSGNKGAPRTNVVVNEKDFPPL